eukprot:TRINITY_DN9312_c2_g1_i1.p1 TRINITY_DN9312_c2_g1~~TRINITY_DN9312_c2_g1_i1.p1  ORF type:complete len:257 (+),score=51.94 TRINITY_DN9312_c2_g1_i1:90-860(+)
MVVTINQLLGETNKAGSKHPAHFFMEETETETGSLQCLSEGDLESEKDLEQAVPYSTMPFPPGHPAHVAVQRGFHCRTTVPEKQTPCKGGQLFVGSAIAQTLLDGLRARGSRVIAQLPQQHRSSNKKVPPQKQPQGRLAVSSSVQQKQQQQQQQQQQWQPAMGATAAQFWQHAVDDWQQLRCWEPVTMSVEGILPAPMKVPVRLDASTHLNLDPNVPVKKKPFLFPTDSLDISQLSPARVSVSQLAFLWSIGMTMN